MKWGHSHTQINVTNVQGSLTPVDIKFQQGFTFHHIK